MGIRESKLRKRGSNGSGYKRIEEDEEDHVVAPKGYVPIWVGVDENSRKRFMVHTRDLRDAHFCEMLGRSAEEFGFRNDGVLWISFEARDFEEWMITRSKHNIKKVRPV